MIVFLIFEEKSFHFYSFFASHDQPSSIEVGRTSVVLNAGDVSQQVSQPKAYDIKGKVKDMKWNSLGSISGATSIKRPVPICVF